MTGLFIFVSIMKYLIAGLGNIGPEYKNTRHNIGFLILDELAKRKDAKFEVDKLAFRTEIKHKGRTFILIKPTTYMNLSGKAVRYFLQQEKIKTENLLVVTDDLALPFGKIRMKAKGSAGGHNGMKNIELLLESSQYARLRFGVGDEFAKGRQVEYVLNDFSNEETKHLEEYIDKSVEGILSFGSIGLERTMNYFN